MPLTNEEKKNAATAAATSALFSIPQISNELSRRNLSPNDLIRSDLANLVNDVVKIAATRGTEDDIRGMARDLILKVHWPAESGMWLERMKASLPTQATNLNYGQAVTSTLVTRVSSTIAWGERELARIEKFTKSDETAALDFRADRFSQICAGVLGMAAGAVPLQDIFSAGSQSAGARMVTGWGLVSGEYAGKVEQTKAAYIEYRHATLELSNLIDALKGFDTIKDLPITDLTAGRSKGDYPILLERVDNAREKMEAAASKFRAAASGFSTINENVEDTTVAGVKFGLAAATSMGTVVGSGGLIGKEIGSEAMAKIRNAVGDKVASQISDKLAGMPNGISANFFIALKRAAINKDPTSLQIIVKEILSWSIAIAPSGINAAIKDK